MYLKSLTVFFVTLLSYSSFLYGQSKAWLDLFSYLKVQHIQITQNKIYAQSENAFFVYYPTSGEIEKISSIQGLTGEEINNFYYDESLQKLWVFHTGGLIEILDAQQKVFRSPELSYNAFIPQQNKIVNQVFEKDDLLYMATGYGVSVYNLAANEFGDTYYIQNSADLLNVNAVLVFQDKIYAATDQGLFEADLNANLIDPAVWLQRDTAAWQDLAIFDGKLLGVRHKDIALISPQSIQNLIHFDIAITGIKTGQFISACFPETVKLIDKNFIIIASFDTVNLPGEQFFEAVDNGNNLLVASTKHGLINYDLTSFTTEFIHPDSPLSNHVFTIDAADHILWMAYGDRNAFNPYPLFRGGLSSYQQNKWINIPYEDFQISDISFVKISPSNPSIVYFSSPKNGLIRIKDNQVDKIFNQNNSPLSMFLNDGVRVFAMDFDTQNNLWVSHVVTPALAKLKPDDTWESVDLSSILYSFDVYHGTSTILADQEGHIYMGTEYFGLLGYNPQTQSKVYLTNGLQTTAYPQIETMDLDKNGVLWVGNREGLRILNQPEELFTRTDLEFKPIKIVYEDAVQLLMEGQNITKIKVDGANNKWIATLGSGVYYFNEDGTQTIYHFTKENSPLPDNDVYDIAIDGTQGLVYFATLNGLTAFKGLATDSAPNLNDVYAFPNPVNLKKHNFVTIRGLIEGVNVKIVDVAGNLVYESTAKGGSMQWDLTAFGRYKIASGVYIALITNEDGSQTQTTKILVIK